MNKRSILLGLAIGGATAMLSTAALADSITVAVNYTNNQQTTTTPGGTQYSGAYSLLSGTRDSSNPACYDNAQVLLSYASQGTLTIDIAKFCFDGAATSFNSMSGTGIFKNATGAGQITFSAPNDFTLTAGQGSDFFSGLGRISATPELDSVVLFGGGALGLAGYGLTRLRARKRRTHVD